MCCRRKIENCSKIPTTTYCVVLRYELRYSLKIGQPGSHKLRHCLIQNGNWWYAHRTRIFLKIFLLFWGFSYTSKCKTNCWTKLDWKNNASSLPLVINTWRNVLFQFCLLHDLHVILCCFSISSILIETNWLHQWSEISFVFSVSLLSTEILQVVILTRLL